MGRMRGRCGRRLQPRETVERFPCSGAAGAEGRDGRRRDGAAMSSSQHIFCLTVDTDPDGANSPGGSGANLSWNGLDSARSLPARLGESLHPIAASVPITWFVRIDGQIETLYGTPFYLLEKFADIWEAALGRGDEIGWHPHLQQPGRRSARYPDPGAACEELSRLWEMIRAAHPAPRSFRNGEGWQTPDTLARVESFGIACDSSAIPGTVGGPEHPRNWIGTPNHPYFPDPRDVRRAGAKRPILELPMTTWRFAAPYDSAPRTRYMNPAVHPAIFTLALEDWAQELAGVDEGLWVWVLILHPDEAFGAGRADALYARRPEAVVGNIENLARTVERAGHEVDFATLSRAADRWRRSLDEAL